MDHLIRLSDALAAIPGGDHCDPQAVADALRALPAAKQFATLYQHSETGRTRVVMFGDVADCDARWQVVGPLVIAQASAPAVALNGLTEAETSATASVAGLTPAAAPKEESPAAQQLVKVLTVVRDTLPHIGGNAMSVHSLLKDIDAALSAAPKEEAPAIAATLNGIASLTETTIRDAAREYADADGEEAGFIDGARWALSILRGNNGA